MESKYTKCVFFLCSYAFFLKCLLIYLFIFHIMLVGLEGCSMAKKEKKKGSKFKYFIVFVLFIGIGIALGRFGTQKYLDYKASQDKTPVVEDGPVDITDDSKYQDTINRLRGILDGNPMFYSTKGVSASTLDNTSRLNLLYAYIENNNLATTETLNIDFIGASTCNSGAFLLDKQVDATLPAPQICTVVRISSSLLKDLNRELFNDEILDTSVAFNVGLDRKCVVSTESYLCGSVTNVSGYIGELESKFDVTKVTKDTTGTLVIYEKGYLIDNRSNVDNPTDQYDNYYLHSSDSKEYYYELKSADNLTFKHTFKTEDNENYYYVGTELVKE